MLTRAKIKDRLEKLAELRKARQADVEQLLQASFGEGRAQTSEEQTKITEARDEVARIDVEAEQLRTTDADLAKREADAAEANPGLDVDESRQQAAGDARKRNDLRVGREPRTYERHDMRTSYLRDLAAVQLGHGSVDPSEARQRLDAHSEEVRVDLPAIEARQAAQRGGYAHEIRADGEEGPAEIRYQKEQRALDRVDGSGGHFVPPLWMVEDFIGLSRASRVVADRCNGMPLPPGTDSINIPRVATGSSTAAQTADNAAISDTDMTDDSVQANVRTIAGQQDVALQLLDQSPVAFDQIVFADLAEDHAVTTDVQVIDGSNAAGQHRGILAIPSVDTTTYTDASPTVPELYPALADSANEIATNRHRPVTAIFMHPRRWYWMLAASDANSRPLVAMGSQGPQNALFAANEGNPFAEGGPVGMSPFGPIWIDPNIPVDQGGGTEDVIIETRPQELYLWEGPVRMRAMQEVGSATLTVRFQLFNYQAFMPHRRPENTSVIAGTGLIAPTF